MKEAVCQNNLFLSRLFQSKLQVGYTTLIKFITAYRPSEFCASLTQSINIARNKTDLRHQINIYSYFSINKKKKQVKFQISKRQRTNGCLVQTCYYTQRVRNE